MPSDDPKKVAKDIADRAAAASGDAASSAKSTASDVGESAQSFASRASDTASDVYGKAKDHLKDAADQLPDASGAIDAGRRAYEKSSDTVGRQVAKQPIEALLLAGAIGYLVGWATTRS